MTRPDPALPFKLGFLSHVNGFGKPAAQVYSELIDEIQAAEDLGFDGVFLAQHHFGEELRRLPSPLVLLAAAAQRTSRIELGTAISTIPFGDPLRFVEDAAVLDELSGGRVQLGLGTGGANDPHSAQAFGFDAADADARYDEAVALLHAATEGRAIRDSPLTLQPPVPGLRSRIWQATARVEKAERVASSGDGLLIGSFSHRPEDDQRPLIDAYLAAWDHAEAPRIGAARAVFPSSSRAAALEDLGRGLALFRDEVRAHLDLDEYDDEQLAARINVHYGTSEQIVESLRADPALFGYVDYFFPVVQHEASNVDEEISRLDIIATQIAPALGWRRTAAVSA